MGLADFEVFNAWSYSTATEVLQQQLDLFNAASGGAIILRPANNTGDFTDAAHYALIADLIRRRNAYSDGDVAEKNMEMLLETSVKVAGAAGPIRIDPHWWDWINRSPEEAGVVFGQQLAVAMAADMLNTSIGALVAAMNNDVATIGHSTTEPLTFQDLLTGTSKFGDQSQRLSVWVMHSNSMFTLWGDALTNTASLFNWGTLNVRGDAFGRRFVITDSPSLVDATPNPDQYYSLGLTPGAVIIEQNDDYLQNVDTTNGGENIRRTIQAQWTNNLGVKGYTWDKTSGGKSPNNAALTASANWDRVATSHKDLPGVIVKTE
jgi:hypothetical protein